ncbi:hypothetical protein KQI82_02835 [Oscillibacter sp. MSJ-2]|uniref:Uncharacterized protein n=1 Tax=Dysosmobacter acutus TaxID=2841504 RepID=A0ABS6F6T9_9FIRM|nr:hypothetical protein [Dysosmobacter acutus]MBU5625872.1 hypothetical protein [Dysosmobacter acutus]
MKDWRFFAAAAAAVFAATLFLGALCLENLPFGYLECALLYLSAVIAVSALWIGWKK